MGNWQPALFRVAARPSTVPWRKSCTGDRTEDGVCSMQAGAFSADFRSRSFLALRNPIRFSVRRMVPHNSQKPTQHGTNQRDTDRKSTRLNSSHLGISYAVFCLKQK